VTGLTEPILSWSLAASFGVAMTARTLRDGQRRGAINEALHELRRPLQAIALAADRPGPAGAGAVQSSTRLAAAALEQLEREVNGGPRRAGHEAVRCEEMLRAAVGRWRAPAAGARASLELRWWARDATVHGERSSLEQALDNLIVNAIEHGGPAIVVEGRRRGDRLCLSVADSGGNSGTGPRAWSAALALLGGSRRRGHGLAVVRRVAAEHGGVFALDRRPRGTLAAIVLPLAGDRPRSA
jgi:signal transduction histidine kinase